MILTELRASVGLRVCDLWLQVEGLGLTIWGLYRSWGLRSGFLALGLRCRLAAELLRNRCSKVGVVQRQSLGLRVEM